MIQPLTSGAERRSILRVVVLLVAVLPLATTTSGLHPDRPPGDERYVVLISIDGVPASALWNQDIPIPTIRSLAREGVWAEAMVPSTPTKTWLNHTSLTTGVHPSKHGMLTNGRFTEVDGPRIVYENDLDRKALSTYPTIFDRAHEAGLRTAGVNWPVTRNTETLDDNFPDAPNELAHMTPKLRSELVDRGLLEGGPDVSYRHGSPPGADYTWTSAATHLIESRTPNLLLFHLLNVDTMHHRHGPSSWPGFTALAYADAQVNRILEALEEAGIREQATVFVVSDHGFMTVENVLHPNVLLREEGLLQDDGNGHVERARVQAIENGGSAMVYATEIAEDGDLDTARALFEDAEGIARVVGPEAFAAYGLPQPSEDERMGDLLLDAAEGYAFGDSTRGSYSVTLDEPTGKHGYTSRAPGMKTIFVASGRGVRSGVELDTIDIRSVAPTAARLLGLDLETADGEVLDSILE